MIMCTLRQLQGVQIEHKLVTQSYASDIVLRNNIYQFCHVILYCQLWSILSQV